MLDDLAITEDTILRQLSSEADLELLYNFLVADTATICKKSSFTREDFFRRMRPAITFADAGLWVWEHNERIIAAVLFIKRKNMLQAYGITLHRNLNLEDNIHAILEDARKLLRYYECRRGIFAVEPNAPQIPFFDKYLDRYTGDYFRESDKIQYEIQT